MKNNSNFYENIIKNTNGKIKKSDIENAKKGDINALLGTLSNEDAQKVKSILSSKEKTKEFLSSDAAQKLLKMLGGK
ncbi:MAG: hypothetical protein MJ080_05895 [Clostridia bacterium]|nr:hypothetical protein [Clostridia bacterium]